MEKKNNRIQRIQNTGPWKIWPTGQGRMEFILRKCGGCGTEVTLKIYVDEGDTFKTPCCNRHFVMELQPLYFEVVVK